MATDIEERFAQGAVAIIEGLASLQTIMGRSSNLIVAWEDWQRVPEDVDFPVIAYDLTVHREIGGAGDNRRIVLTLSCFDHEHGSAQAMDPKQRTRQMVEAIELGFTQPALAAQGLDACVVRRERPPVPPDLDGTEGLARSTIALDCWITK